MTPNAPLSPSGVVTVYQSDYQRYSYEQRTAAARAILRHTIHTDGRHLAENRGAGLHPSYIDLHGRGNDNSPQQKEVRKFLKDMRDDLFDASVVLDRLDGGISLILRCPGFVLDRPIQADDLTVDVLFSPRETTESGKELSKFLALTVQAFAHDCVVPYLHRFAQRCIQESVIPPPLVAP
ncbi:hypothetical protein DXG01_011512, partial [Tephrocybe rancida]